MSFLRPPPVAPPPRTRHQPQAAATSPPASAGSHRRASQSGCTVAATTTIWPWSPRRTARGAAPGHAPEHALRAPPCPGWQWWPCWTQSPTPAPTEHAPGGPAAGAAPCASDWITSSTSSRRPADGAGLPQRPVGHQGATSSSRPPAPGRCALRQAGSQSRANRCKPSRAASKPVTTTARPAANAGLCMHTHRSDRRETAQFQWSRRGRPSVAGIGRQAQGRRKGAPRPPAPSNPGARQTPRPTTPAQTAHPGRDRKGLLPCAARAPPHQQTAAQRTRQRGHGGKKILESLHGAWCSSEPVAPYVPETPPTPPLVLKSAMF